MKIANIKNESEYYAREAIIRLFGLQLSAGLSVREVRDLAADCIAIASKDVSGTSKKKSLDIMRLGSVLRTWHKETRFLTREGMPRSLGIDGRFGLRSLVGIHYPSGKFDAVFSKLKQVGLIEEKRGERWAPTARHARISELSEETLAHLSEGVARFVETVTQNAIAPTKEELLFERCCKVTKLPKTAAPAFREFVRQQAFTFLIAVDDWLESRVVKKLKAGKEACTAGVFAFAFVDGSSQKKQRRRSKK
jgi:hypothetical protein